MTAVVVIVRVGTPRASAWLTDDHPSGVGVGAQRFLPGAGDLFGALDAEPFRPISSAHWA